MNFFHTGFVHTTCLFEFIVVLLHQVRLFLLLLQVDPVDVRGRGFLGTCRQDPVYEGVDLFSLSQLCHLVVVVLQVLVVDRKLS